MALYPEILISRKDYPELDEKSISDYFFIRRTEENIYPLLAKYKPLELIDKIFPNTKKRDIFVFSVSLYGYFEVEHLFLKVSDKNFTQYWDNEMPNVLPNQIIYSIVPGYPIFLCAKNMYQHQFLFEGENYFLSFWHKPTIANYWHFQLFTCDSDGHHLPREPEPGEKEAKTDANRLRRIAIMVLEYLISESICSGSEAKKFQTFIKEQAD